MSAALRDTAPLRSIASDFLGRPVTLLDDGCQRWITAEQAGLCLGYAPQNARKGIFRLHERHNDEFGAEDSRVAKLATRDEDGTERLRSVRIFSRTGCIKLGFFCSTERAKAFRSWAAQALASLPLAAPADAAPSMQATLERLAGSTAQIAKATVALVEATHRQAVKHDLVGRYIALLELNQRGTAKVTPQLELEVFRLKAGGMAQADISRALRLSQTTVSMLLKGTYPRTGALRGEAQRPGLEQALDTALDKAIELERRALDARLIGEPETEQPDAQEPERGAIR